MKLKSLKISTFLFLVLSFQTVFAEITDFSAASCTMQNKSNMSLEQRKKCHEYNNEIDSIEDMTVTDDDKIKRRTKAAARFDEEVDIAKSEAKAEAGKRSDSPYCEEYKKNPTVPLNQGLQAVGSYGSTGLQKCDKLSLGMIKNLYKNGQKQAQFPWEEYVNYACWSDCGDAKAFDNCVTTNKNIVKSCEAMSFVINSYGRDWGNSDHIKPTRGESSSAPGKVTGTTNGQQATTSVGSSSIKCSSEGVETVDYEPCKKFQVQLDLIEGVQLIGYATQELVYKDKMMDSQAKFASEQNSATGGLKATGESLKEQQDMMQQRSAVEATKLAYAYTLYTEMPRSDEVKDKCKSFANREIDKIGKVTLEECQSAITTGSGGYALTQNQQAIEAMRSRLIQIATTTGSNLLLANLLGKRADDVNNAIAKIDAFKPVDPFTTTEADAQTTFCRMNPGAAQCLTGDLDRTFDTMNDNVITFGDGATGTSYGSSTNPDGSIISGGLADSTARTAVGPVGSVIAAAAQDNSMEASEAAKVTAGGTGTTGGGGSGGGGSAGGGGGGGSPAGAGAAGQAAAIAGRAPSYGGGGGSFSVMGGFGINKKKSEGKTEDNPFGKLFGKDGAKTGGVVNFRDIASQKVGGKGENLFDMISKRYSNVNADKRLLEYELAK